nr:centrosomal protein of 162 kDa isoform X1 [Nothobranchius furzeri]
MAHRLTKEDLDAQFEQFLRESVSDESVDLGSSNKPLQAQSQKPNQKPKVSWWQDDDHSSGATTEALSGSRKSYRKSLRKSRPVLEVEGDPGSPGMRAEGLDATFITWGSSKTEDTLLLPVSSESELMPAVDVTNVGLETQEEEEEKARFFAQLESGTSSTIDYSKLNRELDSTSSIMATDLRIAENVEMEQNKEADKVMVTEAVGKFQDHAESPHYSEDFEDDEGIKELEEEKTKMSPSLEGSKRPYCIEVPVEVIGEEDRRKDTDGSPDRGQVYGQSGGSEMEALHEAYRQIQTTKDSEDHLHSSLKENKGIVRPESPLSSPQLVQNPLQLASTSESGLPTAEELMRPIQPADNQTRGFTLQPFRGAEPSNTEGTHIESDLKHPGKIGPTTGVKGIWELKNDLSKSPEPPNHDLTWSIREEVDRLMQDQNDSSQTHSSKAQKHLASHGSSGFHFSASSETTTMRGRAVDRRAAMNYKSSRMSKTAAVPTTLPSKTKPTKNPERDDRVSAESDVNVISNLFGLVQPSEAVLQQQKDSSHQSDAAEDVPASQASSLPRPHLGLQTEEGANRKRRHLELAGPVTEERLVQINKEIMEQEVLIKGYQQENEKLYSEMKSQQARRKVNEEAMLSENQRLLSQLAFTQEQLRRATRPLAIMCTMNHSQQISDLLVQISVLQKNETKLSEDNQRLTQEKQSLESNLQLMKGRDPGKAQVNPTSDKTLELQVLEEKHKQEVAALTEKLQRFSEQRELLDRDAGRLKAATAEILQLKEQVEKLKQEVVRRSGDQQKKSRGRSADTKKIQHLERQVKELKQILRSKNPNSLPAMIYAASMADSDEHGSSFRMASSGGINSLLEHRIQYLEAELEGHDEEAKRSLQAMEQRFHSLKLQYENQIHQLELQLAQRQQVEATPGSDLWVSKCRRLEDELQLLKDNHQEKENYLQEQIKSLQKQVKNMARPSPCRHQRQAEAAFGARIERLNQELATKTRRIQELRRTVEGMQREKRNVLFAPNPLPDFYSSDSKQLPGQIKAHFSAAEAETDDAGTFPPAQYDKTYQPTAFTGDHITEVLQENEALKQRVEQLQQEKEHKEEVLRVEAMQANQELCRLKELHAEQLSSLKVEHLRVLDSLRSTHALEHSSSKVAELTNTLNCQEIAMKHVQEQLSELQGCKEALRLSQGREEVLQKQLTRLLQELKEARGAQSSEVKLLCSLERKIMTMELRQQHREEELQQLIQGPWQTPAADLQSEVECWRRLAQDKSRELDVFRTELDSILDILRHLQKQEVFSYPHKL